jgi:hypothetical protein
MGRCYPDRAHQGGLKLKISNDGPHYVAAIPIASANAARTSGGWP